jgi:hypothetical protein
LRSAELILIAQISKNQAVAGQDPVAGIVRSAGLSALAGFLLIAATAFAGCGGRSVSARSVDGSLSISPNTVQIDTNCTGCNSTTATGGPALQFIANRGLNAGVTWSVSGGDASAGSGSITSGGQYTPPSYLTSDRAEIEVTASFTADPAIRATSVLVVTPGFLQPLTPENVALGPNGSVNVTGVLAEAGGGSTIRFALSDSPGGSSGGEGSLSAPTCQRAERAFTSCTVTYTAPPIVQSTGVTYIVASVSDLRASTQAAVLLNAAGIASNPAGHQGQLSTPMLLGSSGGNNNDFDAHGNTIVDCCSGTLGALIEDGNGKQYLLSNNHVLARSDHASVGDSVVQPGLIDNNCTPNGDGAGTLPVGALTTWLPLDSSLTNADAAIAEVASRTVDPTGRILELGSREPDGTLTAAPPGISSTAGKGEVAGLQMRVAKSGRTTGLTCGGVSAVSVDVSVDYFRDCAETQPYLTKTFTNQIAVSGDRFTDAGDSGALIVDAENAEPVGLYFAGGTDASGVVQGVANPAADVLSELGSQIGGVGLTFVGEADHPVSCLSYGDSTVSAAQKRPLSDAEIIRVQHALTAARLLTNPTAGILGVAMGKSSDRPGEAAVIVYVSEDSQVVVPQSISGVRTVVIPADAHSVANGAAPLTIPLSGVTALSPAIPSQALAVKRQIAHTLMKQNPAFFGVGVGQSLDDPRQAALVIYVDRRHIPIQLPQTVDGVRTRYVVMDRFHVTRSFASPLPSRRHCLPHAPEGKRDQDHLVEPLGLNLD